MSVTQFLETLLLDWRATETYDKIVAFAINEACLFGATLVEDPNLDLTRLRTEHPRLALNIFRNAYRNVDAVVDQLPVILSGAEKVMRMIELDRENAKREEMKRIA